MSTSNTTAAGAAASSPLTSIPHPKMVSIKTSDGKITNYDTEILIKHSTYLRDLIDSLVTKCYNLEPGSVANANAKVSSLPTILLGGSFTKETFDLLMQWARRHYEDDPHEIIDLRNVPKKYRSSIWTTWDKRFLERIQEVAQLKEVMNAADHFKMSNLYSLAFYGLIRLYETGKIDEEGVLEFVGADKDQMEFSKRLFGMENE